MASYLEELKLYEEFKKRIDTSEIDYIPGICNISECEFSPSGRYLYAASGPSRHGQLTAYIVDTETEISHEIEFYDGEEGGRFPSDLRENPRFNRTEEFVYLMSEKRGTNRQITIYKTPDFTLHKKISIRAGAQLLDSSHT